MKHEPNQPTSPQRKASSVLPAFRRHLRLPVTALMLGCMTLWTVQVRGATLVWDGGAGTWDTTTLKWDASTNSWTNGSNIAQFSTGSGLVTLGVPITAGALDIQIGGYTLAGGGNALTLLGTGYNALSSNPRGISISAPLNTFGAGNNITAISADTVLGASQNWGTGLFTRLNHTGIISDGGSAYGIAKDGLGTLVLSGANTFTGQLTVDNGVLVVTSADALGAGTSTIQVNGDRNTFGGTLMIASPTLGGAGITTSRNFFLSGGGVVTGNGITTGALALSQGALSSVGNNTISGSVTTGSFVENRISSSAGMLTLSGPVTLGTGVDTFIYGPGNTTITGAIGASTGRLLKASSGSLTSTLILSNSANAFSGTIRVDGGTVRVSNGGALGTSTAAAALDFSGGSYEIRTDNANVGSFSTKNISQGNGNGTVFVDRAIGGYGAANLNQTVDFGSMALGTNRAFTVTGRNGYGFSIGTVGINMGGNGASNPSIATTTVNGLTTFDGNVTLGDATAGRTFTFTTAGDAAFNGAVLTTSTGGGNLFVKAGAGTLSVNPSGQVTTINGNQSINAGTFSLVGATGTGINNFFNSTGNIVLGGGTFNYATSVIDPAVTRVFNLNNAVTAITANQSAAAPLVINSNFAASSTAAKVLNLGGSNTQANEIKGVILDNTAATAVRKFGSGTWVLSGANTNTGALTVAGGTLRLAAQAAGATDIYKATGAVIFDNDAFTNTGNAAGILNYVGSGAGSQEALGALTPTAGHR